MAHFASLFVMQASLRKRERSAISCSENVSGALWDGASASWVHVWFSWLLNIIPPITQNNESFLTHTHTPERSLIRGIYIHPVFLSPFFLFRTFRHTALSSLLRNGASKNKSCRRLLSPSRKSVRYSEPQRWERWLDCAVAQHVPISST